MFIEEIIDKKFETVFESMYKDLNNKLENDPDFGIDELKALLNSLYVDEGNDWLGRGDLKSAATNATICACESILAEYEERRLDK